MPTGATGPIGTRDAPAGETMRPYFVGVSDFVDVSDAGERLLPPPATTISTRRLFARPSGVSLLATGLALPLPTEVILSEGMPLLTR